MKKHWLIFVLCVAWLHSYAQTDMLTPKVSCGRLVRWTSFKSKYVDARNVDIWLPEGYSKGEKYPVLYMHDGQMLFDSASTWNHKAWDIDETLCMLNREKETRPCIVVGIWNNGSKRKSEYFPQKSLKYLKGNQKAEVERFTAGEPLLADKYLKFIIKELKPAIDREFSTFADRENTFVGGSSMGGLISMYAMCEYPKVFGGAICMSTHWPVLLTNEPSPFPDALLAYLDKKIPVGKGHKIYFDHGTTGLDANYLPLQSQADKVMATKKYGPKNWTSRVFTGEDHSETDWGKRFYVPALFMLSVK